MRKANKVLLIIVSILVFLTTMFLTYAYFSINVSGNEDAELITVTTGILQLQYSEGNNQISGINIEPGWESGNKVINVKNIGTLASYYEVVFQEINNNITNGEIRMEGTCVSKYTDPNTNATTVSGTCGNIDSQSISVTTDGYAIKSGIFIQPNYTHEYTIKVYFEETNEDQNYNQGRMLIGKLGINETRAWYDAVMLSSNPDYLTTKMLAGGAQPNDTIAMNNQKSNIKLMATLNESMLYYTTETNETQDGSRVYYYAGNTEENHVIFAGFCWRIVRTNEDGSIRLRYNGEPNNGSCPVKGTQVYPTYVKNGTTISGKNVEFDTFDADVIDNRYVGYMYGSSCTSYETCHANEISSNRKRFVDEWYQYTIGSNLVYDSKVVLTDFCNDRSLMPNNQLSVYYKNTNMENGSGIGNEFTVYGSFGRLYGETVHTLFSNEDLEELFEETGFNYAEVFNDTATYKCPQANDILRLKAGLLTMDEVMNAGALGDDFYLRTSNGSWSMTPISFDETSISYYLGSGDTSSFSFNSGSKSVLPVISLKADTHVSSGEGTNNKPYIISDSNETTSLPPEKKWYNTSDKYRSYHITVPENATTGMPLVIYMRGTINEGTFDNNISLIRSFAINNSDFYLQAKNVYGESIPFILMQPLAINLFENFNENGSSRSVINTLYNQINEVCHKYMCNRDKIAIVGFSAGSVGVWAMVNNHKDFFSKAISVSATCSDWLKSAAGCKDINPHNFKNTPIKAFVGSEEMGTIIRGNNQDNSYGIIAYENVNSINNAGGNAEHIIVNGANHSSVQNNLYNRDLLEWLLD